MFTCGSENIIYFIIYSECGQKYVEEKQECLSAGEKHTIENKSGTELEKVKITIKFNVWLKIG